MPKSPFCYYGFRATRKSLIALNCFYILLGFLLILTGAYAKSVSIVTSVSVLGGIIAAGVFLVLVALLGVYGARKQHQPALFFYMIILSSVFVVQFSVAVACLANVSNSGLEQLVEVGWNGSSKSVQWDAQKAFGCCGLRRAEDSTSNCRKLPCWSSPDGCVPCLPSIVAATSDNLSRVGFLGAFFSFTELLGIWLAYRFRDMRDPSIDPDSLF